MAVGRDRFQHQVINDSVEAAIGRIVRILEEQTSADPTQAGAQASQGDTTTGSL